MSETIDDKIFEQYIESNRQLTMLLMKEIHERLNEYGDLQHTAFAVLKILQSEGPISQHEIAVHMCHTDASISKLVAILTEKQYVKTQQDPQNRRRVVVELTTQGQKELKRVQKYLLSELRHYFEGSTNKKILELTKFNEELYKYVIKKQKEKNAREN